MKVISFREFDAIYHEVVRGMLARWTREMQLEIATHSRGWSPELFDFKHYLEASAIRFYKAYRSFAVENDRQKVCDVGGLYGVFPLTLKAIGYDVTMTEALKYYGTSFDGLFKFVAGEGVKIADYDPFEPESALAERFDVITVMAVIEHYPHSLKIFMENLIALMKPGGKIYLEVPNIAYLPKRLKFLLGRTPHTDIQDIFHSKVPFIGHHHEFTIRELRDLARLSGLSIISENFFNYSVAGQPLPKRLLKNSVLLPVGALLKDSRECIGVLCELDRLPTDD